MDGEHPISHLGPKDLPRTGGLEHYLVYGRPNQIPNLVGKTDHNVGGLACILRYWVCQKFSETSRKKWRLEKLEILVQNQSFWNIVSEHLATVGEITQQVKRIVWWTNPPFILQIRILTALNCHGHSFSCSSTAPWNNYCHFPWFWNQLYGPLRLGLSTEVRMWSQFL